MKVNYEPAYHDQERINRNSLYRAIRSCKNPYQVNAANFVLHQIDDFFRGKLCDLRLNKKIQYICTIFGVPLEDTFGGFKMYNQFIHSDTFYEISDLLKETGLIWKKKTRDDELFVVSEPKLDDESRIAANPVLQRIAITKDVERLNVVWFILRAKFDFSRGQEQGLRIARKIALICGALGIRYEDAVGYWTVAQDEGDLRIVSVAARNDIVRELKNANQKLGVDDER